VLALWTFWTCCTNAGVFWYGISLSTHRSLWWMIRGV
jgi:hypothetical protein